MDQTACEKDTEQIEHSQNVLKVTENPMDSGNNQNIVLQRPPAQHYLDEQRPVWGYQSMKQKALAQSRSFKKYVQRETISFFGLNDHDDNEEKRWTNRRNRMLSRRCGGLKKYYETRREQLVSESVLASAEAGVDVVDHSENISKDIPHMEDEYTIHKDPVYKMTLNGLRYLSQSIRNKLSSSNSQNSRPMQRQASYTTIGDDSVFFRDDPEILRPRRVSQSADVVEECFFEKFLPTSEVITDLEPSSIRESVKPLEAGEGQIDKPSEVSQGWYSSSVGTESISPGPMQQLWKEIVSKTHDNSDRRQYGMGVVGKFFKRSFRTDHSISGGKGHGENIEDSRPYFTYWITTVQILISIISLAVYGFGPIGFHKTQRSSQVLVTRLSLEQVDYFEPDNFWIGPRAADLVHLGAKFTPCMRKDKNIFDAIKKDQDIERETACCIRNDQSGCVQTTRSKCSKIISSWKKWNKTNPGPPTHIQDPEQASSVGEWTFRRFSGSVCGQDPRYCEEPASAHPFEWPDDISKWPICKQPVQGKDQADAHMACEVIGRPCCVGIYGECRITTKEYCDFVKGFFHDEAALCSQVSCLDYICGMIPFYNSEVPDQFYRLWTSLFLHAGIVHLFITIIIQYYFMRDLEKLTGPFRIGIVYIISGIAGNLASAIFVPYRAEVGPAGSQFGLLACFIAEVIHCWSELKQPGLALLRLLGVALVLFILGLLPWVDNYSHLFGFIFGFLLSYALLPFLSFGKYDRTRKIIIIVLCLLAVVILFLGLVILFYVRPINECPFCKYFNCIPFTHDFCETQDISVLRKEEF